MLNKLSNIIPRVNETVKNYVKYDIISNTPLQFNQRLSRKYNCNLNGWIWWKKTPVTINGEASSPGKIW